MIYELWDMETHNIVGAYEREEEALAVVRSAIDIHGMSYSEALALVRSDLNENVETLAFGAALARRAMMSVPAAASAGQ